MPFILERLQFLYYYKAIPNDAEAGGSAGTVLEAVLWAPSGGPGGVCPRGGVCVLLHIR